MALGATLRRHGQACFALGGLVLFVALPFAPPLAILVLPLVWAGAPALAWCAWDLVKGPPRTLWPSRRLAAALAAALAAMPLVLIAQGHETSLPLLTVTPVVAAALADRMWARGMVTRALWVLFFATGLATGQLFVVGTQLAWAVASPGLALAIGLLALPRVADGIWALAALLACGTVAALMFLGPVQDVILRRILESALVLAYAGYLWLVWRRHAGSPAGTAPGPDAQEPVKA